MLLQTYSTAFLEVAYRPDLGQLTGRWLKCVTEPELLFGYDSLRRAALHHDCGNWLIDSRRRAARNLASPEWVTTHFLPQVQRELGTPLRVCFLLLPDYVCTLTHQVVAGLATTASSSQVQFASFLDEGSANAWLVTQSIA